MKKQLTAWLLALVMLFSLVGCGADSRGAKRILFSIDGLIYYTEDHYKSFELLYGEE